jgi:hypothetical protein
MGGAAIDSYNLQWRAGTSGAWINIQGQVGSLNLATTGSITDASIAVGSTYQFQVRAHNILDYWGSFSIIPLSVVQSDVPAAPAETSISIVDTNVKIQWNMPVFNSAAIDAYRIYIRPIFGVDIEETTYCNGADP